MFRFFGLDLSNTIGLGIGSDVGLGIGLSSVSGVGHCFRCWLRCRSFI